MGISIQDILTQMLTAAETTAGAQWDSASSAIVSEFKIFGHRLEQIAAGLEAKELTEDDAKDFFAMAQNNMVSLIAMATTLVFAAVQKIVNAALAAAKDAINTFVKIPILV